MAFFSFDASTVAPQQTFDNSPIPAGTYNAQVIESDLKPLKSGNGTGLALTFEILDGQFAKRRLWANLNVQHNNPQAQQIGQQQLSGLCHAVGVIRMTDSSQLHHKPVKVRVKIRQDAQYGDKNEITGYEALNGAAKPTVPSAAPTPTAANAAPVAPWAKAA